jgi:hypothetical protein
MSKSNAKIQADNRPGYVNVEYTMALNAKGTQYDWVETGARIVAAYKAAYAPLVKAGTMTASEYAMTMSCGVNDELTKQQNRVRRLREKGRRDALAGSAGKPTDGRAIKPEEALR